MSEQPASGDERLDQVQERIDEARAAASELHEDDVLGDRGDEPGSGRPQSEEQRAEERQSEERQSEEPEATRAPDPNPR
ncbi:MAG: hypothetical protein JNL54_11260 [Kineosporiaceae bacterium]|nr:hypothetical protein [Kineosporiaceae bacterium]